MTGHSGEKTSTVTSVRDFHSVVPDQRPQYHLEMTYRCKLAGVMSGLTNEKFWGTAL